MENRSLEGLDFNSCFILQNFIVFKAVLATNSLPTYCMALQIRARHKHEISIFDNFSALFLQLFFVFIHIMITDT